MTAASILTPFPGISYASEKERDLSEKDLKDYLHIMADFDKSQSSDIILDKKDFVLLKATLKKLRKIQRTVGFGNYCILSFDNAIKFSRQYPAIAQIHQK